MTLSFRELTGMSQASTGGYRDGLGKKPCCESCAHGGACEGDKPVAHFPCMACGKLRPTDGLPCPWCRQNAGWARSGGLSVQTAHKVHSHRRALQAGFHRIHPRGARVPPGLEWRRVAVDPGFHTTTVIQGQADLEPGDYGYQFPSTTKSGTTVFGRRQGFVDPSRRIAVTRMVDELEFLAGTPGVHPRVLAQKVWEARKALMGIGDWEWANYQNQQSAYDSKSDLEARVAAVERVLGVAGMSPKLMSQLYGMSGLGGWLDRVDPVTKLARCIQGALCAPRSFCCPPGTCFPGAAPASAGGASAVTGFPFQPQRTWQPQSQPQQTWIPSGGQTTWLPMEDPDLTWTPKEQEKNTWLPLEEPDKTFLPQQPKPQTVVQQPKPQTVVQQPKPQTVVQQPVVQPESYVGVNHVPGFPGEHKVVVVGTFATAQEAIAAGAQSAVPASVWAKQSRGYQQITPAQAQQQIQRVAQQAQAARALQQQSRPQATTQTVSAPRAPQTLADPMSRTTGAVPGGMPAPQGSPVPAAQIQRAVTPQTGRVVVPQATQQVIQQTMQQALTPAQKAEEERRKRAAGLLVAGAGSAAMLGGLGRPLRLSELPALEALRRSMQQARGALRRKRRS